MAPSSRRTNVACGERGRNEEVMCGHKLAEGLTLGRGDLCIVVTNVLIWAVTKSTVSVG